MPWSPGLPALSRSLGGARQPGSVWQRKAARACDHSVFRADPFSQPERCVLSPSSTLLLPVTGIDASVQTTLRLRWKTRQSSGRELPSGLAVM